jgi:hypothetical protein
MSKRTIIIALIALVAIIATYISFKNDRLTDQEPDGSEPEPERKPHAKRKTEPEPEPAKIVDLQPAQTPTT